MHFWIYLAFYLAGIGSGVLLTTLFGLYQLRNATALFQKAPEPKKVTWKD